MRALGRVLTSHSKWGRLGGSSLVFTILATVVGLSLGQVDAAATTDLPAVVLTSTLPGLVLSPPGSGNGPITPSNVSSATGLTGSAATLFAQHLEDGDVSGYARTWVHQPLNGDAVEILALDFTDQGNTASFLTSFNQSTAGKSGVTTFAVPGIAGAAGYRLEASTASGPAAEYLVTFGRSGTAFTVAVLSTSGDLTNADAVALATRQAANAPGAPPSTSGSSTSTWASKVGEIVGAALLIILVVGLIVIGVQRGRRKRSVTNTAPTDGFQPRTYQPNAVQPSTVRAPSSSSYPPPPTEPQEPGWTAIGDFEWYWDGRAWTNRRELTHAEP